MTRTATKWFDALCLQYLQTGREEHFALWAVSKHLVEFYRMTTHVFTQTVGMRFLQIMCGFAFWCWGCRCMDEPDKICEGDLIAPVRTKVHKMQHLPRFAGIINPRYVQCYGEESLIVTTVQVWKKCMRGRYDRHAQRNVLLKRITGLLLRYEL